jgi:hypothetical protein
MKEEKMDGACTGKKRNACRGLMNKLEGIDHLKDLGLQ